MAFFVWRGDSLNRAKLDTIVALVSEILQAAELVCIEAEWQPHDRILRLYVDKLTGEGINLDGCVQASRLLDENQELDALIGNNATYNLEISSPGVERPLRRREHFARHLGEKVQVRLSIKSQDRWRGIGRLVGVAPHSEDNKEDSLITLETEEGTWSFPLGYLQRASLVYDWGGSSHSS